MNHKSNAFNHTNIKQQHFFITFASLMGEQQTDTRLFSTLFEQYKEPFILFANSYIRDRAVAEDIYVEAMMQYWEKRHELSADTNILAYILTSIKNKSLNHLRHLNVRTEAEEHLFNHNARELNFRISTLESCDPSELFTVEMREIIRKVHDEGKLFRWWGAPDTEQFKRFFIKEGVDLVGADDLNGLYNVLNER